MQEKVKKLRTYKILFVEDERDIVEIISDTLLKLEVDFIVAYDGEEGLQKLKENPDINLLITDINMPIMNGLDMLREIRKFNTDLTCLVMSAHTEKEYINAAKELDVKEYIMKPFDFIEFLNILSKL